MVRVPSPAAIACVFDVFPAAYRFNLNGGVLPFYSFPVCLSSSFFPGLLHTVQCRHCPCVCVCVLPILIGIINFISCVGFVFISLVPRLSFLRESLVHTDYACVHFSQHSWEIVIFQYIPRFTDPAHVIENEAVS